MPATDTQIRLEGVSTPWMTDKGHKVSFFCIGAFTMLLTVANHMAFFMVIALIMGLFDGCFISLLGPIAFDIVGPGGASQAIGCLLAICSIPLTFGPAIAEQTTAAFSYTGSTHITFPLASTPPPPSSPPLPLLLLLCLL
ncbi:Monocarboxylate transporter 10 [Portunus trituberculatus]|uniref:Monocarboxylate transporter 10 n=1 Tax=Portunus trituberculatus TaxID=210409 RepID=A0A5B7DVM2_PORTR|nr:Monocarboxylate transporter 10 [Portunus trituberculatus]